MQIKVSYITANEIMEILGIGRSKAYDIVRGNESGTGKCRI